MASMTVVDREGGEHQIEATVGWTVMEIIREAGLPIEAACGGCCACATCHVYIDPAFKDRLFDEQPQQEEEASMLDEAFEVQESSRLSCQLTFKDSLDGLRVTLAPEF